MDKSKKVYLLLIFSSILFISVYIITFIVRYSNIKGNINIKRKYYEIVYKSNSENININNDLVNVNYYKNNDLYFDIYNVGNIDANVNDILIENINTSLDKDKLNIMLNFNKDDFIKGGESKRININIEYDNEINESNYLSFSIKYIFSK